jgi:hypothetical protein
MKREKERETYRVCSICIGNVNEREREQHMQRMNRQMRRRFSTVEKNVKSVRNVKNLQHKNIVSRVTYFGPLDRELQRYKRALYQSFNNCVLKETSEI